ncbi:MAG TPA: EF-Tu/IF-2/RF-3 family GTPase [Candidatus Nitrosotalea sp.]|nr:EF-Tu/IF-2/RF-3 family GTPase [Candidatus Nitrosotalea sp.]
MKSINYTLLGDDESLAKDFGKKGTATDITIYDKKETGVVKTWTLPTGFPEKIQPLLQAINMGEYVIFHVSKLDKFTGEQIVALDVLKKSKGLLAHTYDVDREKLRLMIKGTVVEQYKIVELADLKKEMDALEPVSIDGSTRIPIDHCFEVKGVGTVILGKVAQGKIKAYDKLKLSPKGDEVLIKSIQMHDDPVEEAISPARVGLAVKGITADDVQRGDQLSTGEGIIISQDIALDFLQNKFFKDNLTENQTFLVNIGMQIRAAKIVSLKPMKLSLNKPASFIKNDICVILKPESQTIRIVGSGPIVV